MGYQLRNRLIVDSSTSPESESKASKSNKASKSPNPKIILRNSITEIKKKDLLCQLKSLLPAQLVQVLSEGHPSMKVKNIHSEQVIQDLLTEISYEFPNDDSKTYSLVRAWLQLLNYISVTILKDQKKIFLSIDYWLNNIQRNEIKANKSELPSVKRKLSTPKSQKSLMAKVVKATLKSPVSDKINTSQKSSIESPVQDSQVIKKNPLKSYSLNVTAPSSVKNQAKKHLQKPVSSLTTTQKGFQTHHPDVIVKRKKNFHLLKGPEKNEVKSKLPQMSKSKEYISIKDQNDMNQKVDQNPSTIKSTLESSSKKLKDESFQSVINKTKIIAMEENDLIYSNNKKMDNSIHVQEKETTIQNELDELNHHHENKRIQIYFAPHIKFDDHFFIHPKSGHIKSPKSMLKGVVSHFPP